MSIRLSGSGNSLQAVVPYVGPLPVMDRFVPFGGEPDGTALEVYTHEDAFEVNAKKVQRIDWNEERAEPGTLKFVAHGSKARWWLNLQIGAVEDHDARYRPVWAQHLPLVFLSVTDAWCAQRAGGNLKDEVGLGVREVHERLTWPALALPTILDLNRCPDSEEYKVARVAIKENDLWPFMLASAQGLIWNSWFAHGSTTIEPEDARIHFGMPPVGFENPLREEVRQFVEDLGRGEINIKDAAQDKNDEFVEQVLEEDDAHLMDVVDAIGEVLRFGDAERVDPVKAALLPLFYAVRPHRRTPFQQIVGVRREAAVAALRLFDIPTVMRGYAAAALDDENRSLLNRGFIEMSSKAPALGVRAEKSDSAIQRFASAALLSSVADMSVRLGAIGGARHYITGIERLLMRNRVAVGVMSEYSPELLAAVSHYKSVMNVVLESWEARN